MTPVPFARWNAGSELKPLEHRPSQEHEVEHPLLHAVGELGEARQVGQDRQRDREVAVGQVALLQHRLERRRIGRDVVGRQVGACHPDPVGGAEDQVVVAAQVRELALVDLAAAAEQAVAVERGPGVVARSSAERGMRQVKRASIVLPGIRIGLPAASSWNVAPGGQPGQVEVAGHRDRALDLAGDLAVGEVGALVDREPGRVAVRLQVGQVRVLSSAKAASRIASIRSVSDCRAGHGEVPGEVEVAAGDAPRRRAGRTATPCGARRPPPPAGRWPGDRGRRGSRTGPG